MLFTSCGIQQERLWEHDFGKMKEDRSLSRLLYQHYLSDTFPIIFFFFINLKENHPVTTNLSW